MTYTINPNAKNVWIRDNEDTMDLSPITDASSVYLENGRTIEQELGEGSMVSNVATVDTSMNKVIDGTLDGAYESCVFKGKSLVNLFDKSKVSPDHTSYTLGSDNTITYVANNGFTNGVKLNHLKPNTKYALFFDVLAVPQEPNIPYRINDDGTNYNINIFGTGQDNPTSGFHSFTTGDDVSDLKFYFYTNLRNVGFKLTLPVIIEYQDGMEDWDIPYFEGLCDAKMPILRNVGKNLFDTENWYSHIKDVNGVSRNGDVITIDSSVNGNVCSQIRNKITWMNTNLDSTKKYVLSYSRDDDGKGMVGCILFGYTDGTYSSTSSNEDGRIKTTNDTSKILKGVIYSWSTQANNGVTKLSSIQLEESPSPTPYEPYKSNILHTPETVTLRSLPNGVRDELNLKTGEYIKRIGEIVFNGDEEWLVFDTVTNAKRFRHKPLANTKEVGTIVCISDRLSTYLRVETGQVISSYTEHIGIEINNQELWIYTEETKNMTIGDFKVWLSQNPITVQYELETPVTTKVVLTQSEPIVKIGTELPNGVCDTYNLLTGEHIQRVKKVVLNGSENWKLGTVKTVTQVFELIVNDLDIKTKRNNLVCDSLPISNGDSSDTEKIASTDSTGVSGKTSSLYMALLKTKASTVEQLKTYLASNPITVWYGLKSPIVTKKNGLPNTYGVTLPNGEVDKYNESTGVYTQNLGKVVLDGSQDEEWTIVSSLSLTNTIAFQYMLSQGSSSRADNLICNSFTPQEGSSDVEHIRSAWAEEGVYKAIALFINKTKLPTQDVSGLRSYLASNNIELYYSLPVSKTIDIPLINVGQVLPNGVCDTYNPITKEYVKMVGEIELKGEESWAYQSAVALTNTVMFTLQHSGHKTTTGEMSDKLPRKSCWTVDEEGFYTDDNNICVRVNKTRLSSPDLNGFKAWLGKTPLTIWYTLKTPITTVVDLDLTTLYSANPIAYENGHVIMESGYDGQSLLPTLEYSTIINRSGQVKSIGEQVLRQEKQLTMLEQMLIQGIIGMDYNNTLLTLNLEIDEVI